MPVSDGSPFQWGQPILESILIPMRDMTERELAAARVSRQAAHVCLDPVGAIMSCICGQWTNARDGCLCISPRLPCCADHLVVTLQVPKVRRTKSSKVIPPPDPWAAMEDPRPRRAKGWDKRFTL